MSNTIQIKKFLTVIFVLLLIPDTVAFSMNEEFLDSSQIWKTDENVISSSINLSNASGLFQYYTDTENHCFYYHLSFKSKNNNSSYDSILGFTITNNRTDYHLLINKDGLTNPTDSILGSFNLSSNFSVPSRAGQEIFGAIEFKNSADKKLMNDINITLLLDNQTDTIYSSLALDFEEEDEVSCKSKSRSASNKSSTKSSNKKSSGRSSNSTTKFDSKSASSYSVDANQNINNNNSDASNDGKYSPAAIENENAGDTSTSNSSNENSVSNANSIFSNKESFSKSSIALLSLSGISAFMGILFVLKGLTIKKNKQNTLQNISI